MEQQTKTILAAGREPERAPAVRYSGTVQEVPLQDAATLETELSALQRRQKRMAPDMDECGEPLY